MMEVNMKLKVALLFLLTSFTGHVHAEYGCPAGMVPYQSGELQSCRPMEQTQQRPAAPRPTGEWIKTWGAIAHDAGGTGSIGVSLGHLSKKEAESKAIAECITLGGIDCKIMMSYRNQCAAIAEPMRDGEPIYGRISSSSAPTIEQAKNNSVQRCSKNNSSNCQVFYSACSEPIFKPFR